MKQFSARLGCLLLALCLSLSSAACAQEIPELLEPVNVQLDTFVACVDDISKLEVHDASVVPYVEEMYFPQAGTIDEVHVIIGQQVKAGDVLVTLNQDAQVKQLESLRADMEALETDAYYAQQLVTIDLAILEAEKRALENQHTPDETAIALKALEMEELLLQQEMEAAVRALKLSELRGKLEALEKEISQNALCAPFDGRVVHMADVSRGSYVSAYAPLMFLADDSRLSVRSEYISAYTLGYANDVYALIGDKRYALTPVEMDTQAYVSLVFSGETPMTDFAIDEPDENITAGKYAAVCLESLKREGVLLVPSNALYMGEGTRYLYVIENGVRVRRDVKTGVTNGIMTQITEGLEEGELVYVKE